MPLYQYRCRVCEHEFDKLVEMSIVHWWCPKCSAKCDRIMSAPAIIKVNGYNADNGYSSSKE